MSDAVESAKDAVTSSSLSDKVSGYANDAMGNIKQTIGRATGDAELEAEGLAQEVKGEAQKGVAEMKKAVGR
ncbi:MAG: CsbD family protein [Hyphomicrobiaceae bacterium]